MIYQLQQCFTDFVFKKLQLYMSKYDDDLTLTCRIKTIFQIYSKLAYFVIHTNYFLQLLTLWCRSNGTLYLLSTYNIRVIHKLRWQDVCFFDHLAPCVDIFYGMKVDKKWTFLDRLRPFIVNVVCKRPLRDHPYIMSAYFWTFTTSA